MPAYFIVGDGESVDVSKTTGDFMIGEDHQDTFQLLIDQLGRDRMQLVPTDFYDEYRGPWRDDRW